MTSDGESLGDIIDAVIVYEKDQDNYESKKVNQLVERKPNQESTSGSTDPSSSEQQMKALSQSIVDGSSDNSVTRKRLSKILRSGDPIGEARTTMVVLARKELTTVLRVIEAIDRMEARFFDKIAMGFYDDAPDYEVGSVLERLERTLVRSVSVIEKVTNNPQYEEFLLAYRGSSDNDYEQSRISKVATNKESRKKLRNIIEILNRDGRDTETKVNGEVKLKNE